MIAKKFVNVSAFVAVTFVQAEPLENFWIYPETELGKCWEALWPDKADALLTDPEIQATFNFDVYYNRTSKADLEIYSKMLGEIGGEDENKNEIRKANIDVISWVLKNKPSDSYPKESTERPRGISICFASRLSEEHAAEILSGNLSFIGKGGCSTVWGNDVYAVKRYEEPWLSKPGPRQAIGVFENTLANLPIDQFFMGQSIDFIAKHWGGFDRAGERVDILERIFGREFLEVNPIVSKTFLLFAQVAAGAEVMHACGYVNTDMKLENVMVDEDHRVAKLIDLDSLIYVARPAKSSLIGTCFYYPPEVRTVLQKGASPAFNVYQIGMLVLAKIAPTFFMEHVGMPMGSIENFQFPGENRDGEGEKAKELAENLKYALLGKNHTAVDKIIGDMFAKAENISGKVYLELRHLVQQNLIEMIDCVTASGGYAGAFNDEELVFIKKFIKDCIAFEPRDRISAAQVSEILQVFGSYLEAKEKYFENLKTKEEYFEELLEPSARTVMRKVPGKREVVIDQIESLERLKKRSEMIAVSSPECPNYDEVKAMAMKDRPKGIPIRLQKRLFRPDRRSSNDARNTIKRLVMVDASYKNTPSYFMCLFLCEDEKAKDDRERFAAEYPQVVQELKNRIYVYGNRPEVSQDMPVSKDLYDKIRAFSVDGVKLD